MDPSDPDWLPVCASLRLIKDNNENAGNSVNCPVADHTLRIAGVSESLEIWRPAHQVTCGSSWTDGMVASCSDAPPAGGSSAIRQTEDPSAVATRRRPEGLQASDILKSL